MLSGSRLQPIFFESLDDLNSIINKFKNQLEHDGNKHPIEYYFVVDKNGLTYFRNDIFVDEINEESIDIEFLCQFEGENTQLLKLGAIRDRQLEDKVSFVNNIALADALHAIITANDYSVLDKLRCPITNDRIIYPYITPGGYSYSHAIFTWLLFNTHEPIENTNCTLIYFTDANGMLAKHIVSLKYIYDNKALFALIELRNRTITDAKTILAKLISYDQLLKTMPVYIKDFAALDFEKDVRAKEQFLSNHSNKRQIEALDDGVEQVWEQFNNVTHSFEFLRRQRPMVSINIGTVIGMLFDPIIGLAFTLITTGTLRWAIAFGKTCGYEIAKEWIKNEMQKEMKLNFTSKHHEILENEIKTDISLINDAIKSLKQQFQNLIDQEKKSLPPIRNHRQEKIKQHGYAAAVQHKYYRKHNFFSKHQSKRQRKIKFNDISPIQERVRCQK